MFPFHRKLWVEYANNANGAGGGVPVVALGLFTGGSVFPYATSGGTQNNLNPGAGWPAANIGRLEVDTTASAETWTGLVSTGLPDGYGLLITVVAGTNILTLNNQAAGSSAANRFLASDNMAFGLGQGCIAVWDTTQNRWMIR